MTYPSNLKGAFLILTKLSADTEDSRNNLQVQVGSRKVCGWNRHGLEVGKQLYLYSHLIKGLRPDAWTSIVESFNIEDNTIKTKNSTYSFEIVKTNEENTRDTSN